MRSPAARGAPDAGIAATPMANAVRATNRLARPMDVMW